MALACQLVGRGHLLMYMLIWGEGASSTGTGILKCDGGGKGRIMTYLYNYNLYQDLSKQHKLYVSLFLGATKVFMAFWDLLGPLQRCILLCKVNVG